jgi:cholesterol transport system auxiliary component
MMTRLRSLLLLVAISALGACSALAPPPVAQTVYDLGAPRDLERKVQGWMPANVEVSAPSWLANSSMQYRRDYLGLASREAYADSRWAGAPAEMLTRFLSSLLTKEGAQATRCRLRVELDEFVQVFEAPAASRAAIRARLALLATRDGQSLARHALSVEVAADGADARGGVRAHRDAVHRLADELIVWMDGLSSDDYVVSACQGKESTQR